MISSNLKHFSYHITFAYSYLLIQLSFDLVNPIFTVNFPSFFWLDGDHERALKIVEAIFNKPATLTDVRLTVSSSEGNGYLYIFYL